MARQIPILPVDLVRQFGNMNVMKPALPHGGNTFIKGALVYVTGGLLAAVPADGVLCYGQTPDRSHATTESVPDILPREIPAGSGAGIIPNYPFSPLDAEFEMNIGVVAAGVVTLGVTTLASVPAVVVGAQFGITIATSGNGAGIQVVDPTEVTALLVQVTAIPTVAPDGQPQTVDDFNPRIRVKIIPSKIQN